MPHNLYLHSALVQSRKLQKDEPSVRSAIRFNTIDSIVALTIAFFVNAAILVLAAMVFFGKESVTGGGSTTTIADTRDGGLPDPSSGKISSAGTLPGPRVIQLGLKFEF